MANITLDQDQLNTLIAQAVTAALGQASVKSTSSDRTERQVRTDTAIVRAFKKLGYKDSQIKLIDRLDPASEKTATILTYNRWIAQGRKVKTGERAVKVKNLRFFHKDQTEALSAEDKASEMEKMQTAIAAYQAKKAGNQRPAA